VRHAGARGAVNVNVHVNVNGLFFDACALTQLTQSFRVVRALPDRSPQKNSSTS
jgi:hypothetical protein